MVSIEQSEYSFGPDDVGNDTNIRIQLIKNSAPNPTFLSLTSFTASGINFSLESMPYS